MEDRWNREEDDSDGIEDVRDALRDYYGTAMVSGFPMAGMDLARVDSMSDEEVLRDAYKNGLIRE